MKILEREIHPSGHRVYRLAGKKILSMKCRKVVSVRRTGAPVLVIRREGDCAGLFCHFNHNLGWMRWAKERGYRFYVDLRTPSTIFTREQPISFNPWDLFFKQECDAIDVACAKKVLMTAHKFMPPSFPGVMLDLYDQSNPEFLGWRDFVQKHIRLSDNMAGLAEKRHAELFGDEHRVLGCLVRGTDYLTVRPKNHPVQPDPAQVVADARRLCEERNLKKVFLATEDRSVRELFTRNFGSDLITAQDDLPDYSCDLLANSGALGDLTRTLNITTEYLLSVILLSRCPCFLAGCVSGSMGAALLSRGFEHAHFYRLGYY